MDEDVALYFPYSRVPRSAWFTKVLLYWDHAESIVPEEHWSRDEPYQLALVDAGLLKVLSPRKVLEDMSPEFVPSFLDALDRHPVHYDVPSMEPMYATKLPEDLLEELKKRGLARPERRGLWSVDVETGDAYMAYLACAVSVKRPGASPVTDHKEGLAMLGLPRPGEQRDELKRMRYSLINAALPAPSGTVGPAKLRKFKDKHGEALKACRAALDEELVTLAQISDPLLRSMQEEAAITRISTTVANLEEDMSVLRRSRLTALGIAGVVAGAAAPLLDDPPPNQLSGALLIAAALALGGKEVATSADERRSRERAPFAYAARVGRL
jgi:hypothetical protein